MMSAVGKRILWLKRSRAGYHDVLDMKWQHTVSINSLARSGFVGGAEFDEFAFFLKQEAARLQQMDPLS